MVGCAIATSAACGGTAVATTAPTCPSAVAPAYPDAAPPAVHVYSGRTGWVHQRGINRESVGVGTWPTLEDCQFAAIELAAQRQDIVDSLRARYGCGRTCRFVFADFYGSPLVCEDVVQGELASITTLDWYPARLTEFLEREGEVRRLEVEFAEEDRRQLERILTR